MTSNRFNLSEYLSSFSFANSLSADLLKSALSSNNVNPIIDYSLYENHIFFGNAIQKLTTNLNYILDNYPIGLTGSSTVSLSSDSVAKYENWNYKASEFQKYLVNYLCGATGVNIAPTITAGATAFNGEVISLNVINRNSQNQLLDLSAVNYLSLLLDSASAYDEGVSTFRLTSGTGSEDFIYQTYDTEIVSKQIPSEIRVSTNRGMDFLRLFPEIYTNNDEEEVFNRFLGVWADFFDFLKGYIDKFPNIYNIDYSGDERAPEGVAQYLIARQLGLELFEGAVIGELPLYYQKVGKKGLQKITHEIWNRVLIDVNDLFKAKGTKTAFDRLVKDFGIYDGFISAREYVDCLETSTNVYETNRLVKLPLFGEGFDTLIIGFFDQSANNTDIEFDLEDMLLSISPTSNYDSFIDLT